LNYLINISEIATAIEGNFPEIPFAHIFGSSANGVVKAGSDIDIAIWYNGNDPLIKVKVLETIEPFVNNTPVDIVNICSANPLLAHEALAGNVLLCARDKNPIMLRFIQK
jgi:predicted nucleotidyltransferase